MIKPNFNTADTTPGSTHNDTLAALVDLVWEMGAASISLGERSYPPTRQVMELRGILPILEKRQVRVVFFDGSNGQSSVDNCPPLPLSGLFIHIASYGRKGK